MKKIMKILKKFVILKEFYLMIRDRKIYILIPIVVAILLISLFMFLFELPALFPFFYAVF